MIKITPQYSKNKIDKAGNILRMTKPAPNDLEWAYKVLENWRGIHSYPVNTFQATLRKKLKVLDPQSLVAQRLKRAPSIIAKLTRFEQMALSRMQDIAGVRAIMTSIQNAQKLKESYMESNFSHELVDHKDYIQSPKETGYRGIHLIYKYSNQAVKDYNGLRVELQIRTKLQHAWATTVETMGTFLKADLKSGEGPREWLEYFALIGSAFAILEETPPLSKHTEFSSNEIYQMVTDSTSQLKVIEHLQAFRTTVQALTEQQRGSYHLILLDLDNRRVKITSFKKKEFEEANGRYTEHEQTTTKSENRQVVLVSTDSINSLQRAYPNFFLDTREFVDYLSQIQQRVSNG